jgi:hypothetical protein
LDVVPNASVSVALILRFYPERVETKEALELWLGHACEKDIKVWQLDQALASAHAMPLRRLRRN